MGSYYFALPANTNNFVLMLVERRRRWANIKPALVYRFVFCWDYLRENDTLTQCFVNTGPALTQNSVQVSF